MPVYKRKSNNKWFAKVNYTNEYGEYKSSYSKDFDTKREAQDEEIKLNLAIKNGTHRTNENNITFQQAFNEFVEYKSHRVKFTTIMTYEPLWVHFTLQDTQISKLTVPMYMKFKKELDETNLSTDRKNKVHKIVKQVCDYANDMYGIDNSVVAKCGGFKDVESIRKKNVNFYTYEEFRNFIQYVDKPQYKALFTFLYFEGTRIGEANALTWKDINFDKQEVTINKTANTKIKGKSYVITSTKKSASDRVIPLEEETGNLLKQLKESQMKYKNFSEDWYVFGMDKPLGESYIHVLKDEASDKAHLKHIRVHDFRHSCAAFLISHLNCQPSMVQAYLGHATLDITLRTYNHLYPNQLASLSDKMRAFKTTNEFTNEFSKNA